MLLGLLVLASLVLVTLYFREPQTGALHAARGAGSAVLHPFQVAADRVVQPFQDAYAYVDGLIGAKQENEALRRELERVQQEATQLRFAFEENQELQRLLGYVSSPSFPGILGRILSRSSSKYRPLPRHPPAKH